VVNIDMQNKNQDKKQNKEVGIKNFSQKAGRQRGAAMLTSVIFFLFITLAIISGLVSPSVREFKNANTSINSKQSFFLSESGIEDAFYRLANNIPISGTETITLGSNTATTTISNLSGNEKQIDSLGNVSGYERKNGLTLSEGAGVGFNYGIQAGDGGFTLSGGSKINGNVYSNGNIQASGGVQITGTAIAAGATSYIGDGLGNPYMGTVVIGSQGIGDAWAYKVLGANVAGNLYCQLPATFPSGNKNNKACDTSKGLPSSEPLPFTQTDINNWKAEGEAGGIISGSVECPGGSSGGNCTVNSTGATFGPGKITGNLVVNGGGTLTLTGNVWVVGTVTVTGGGKIKLPANFSQYSATIVSDGYVLLNGGSYTGSGSSGSYLFVVSTSTCPSGSGCSGNNAITMSGGSGTIAVAAESGTVSLGGGISINSAVGQTVTVTGGTTLNYQQGLASPSFQSGPSGSWVINSWQED
jgi:hypothetical protein